MVTQKGEKTKEQIMKATVSFIMNNGIENIGINKVIKEAHVSKGSFYHYFSNINDLMKEVAIYTFENTLSGFYIHETDTVEDLVRGLGEYIYHSVQVDKGRYYILFLCISKSFFDDGLKESFQSIFRQLVQENLVAKQIMKINHDEKKETVIKKLQGLDMIALGFIIHCQLFDGDQEHLLSVWSKITRDLYTD
ncbi:TetR/AcrR family transcriptional regulator [Bacillus carboniphilus]|uniref:TetR/AcrR family transcriptional regulator n=1 Tax=Bacillus carboniphilus TaxID=86663 RepID=A0ABY9JRY9_9BACI|nr:TetR/AcrR family transcriptional regulator [Bacillus carboniphilus]WLR42169.1 TetR/AcrR family transcriptional regulator [Bacillus carboniphilus]